MDVGGKFVEGAALARDQPATQTREMQRIVTHAC